MTILSSKRNSDQPEDFFQFTHGVDLDRNLYVQELHVQRVWVDVLHNVGTIDESEVHTLHGGLTEIESAMANGSFPWRILNEDIHMNIESFLTEKFGEVGKKIHYGRSRNDLIATTLRLYTRDCLENLTEGLTQLASVFLKQARDSVDVLVPAMTHRQSAQPMRLSHFWLHYGFSICRDLDLIAHAMKSAMAQMPLGSAAICGSTLNIDLDRVAHQLGFESGPWSAYDCVSDRDFMLEALMGYSVVALHVTKLCEDLIYWGSTPIGLFRLPRAWSSGSSIMPNKRNPDIPEVARARCSQVMGKAYEAQCLLKGLPSGYSSDLHELKRVYMDSHFLLTSSVRALTSFFKDISPSKENAERLLEAGHILATDVANSLAQEGMSFREAYQKTAGMVEEAEASGIQVHHLPGVAVSMERSVERRDCKGGTSRRRTLEGIGQLLNKLSNPN